MVDVFQIDGKWYMTLTTGRNNGGTDLFSDPDISRAQVWASADSPEGPFLEDPEDNVFIGGQYDSGYSSRTILFRNQLRVLYTDSNHGKSVLSLPKNVGVNAEGKLRAYYAADLLEQLRQSALDTSIAAQPYTSFAWKTRGGEWKKTGDRLSCTTDPNSWQAVLYRFCRFHGNLLRRGADERNRPERLGRVAEAAGAGPKEQPHLPHRFHMGVGQLS